MSEMSPSRLKRNGLTALGVLSLHAGLIWALLNSLVAPAPELVVPMSLLAQAPDAPTQVEPATASQPSKAVAVAPPPVQPKAVTKPVAVQPKPERTSPQASTVPRMPPMSQLPPLPHSPAAPPTEANKPVGAPAATTEDTTQATGTAVAAPSSAGTGAPSAPAARALYAPSSDADHLRNPKPVYPALSKRLNEQGTVIHSVLIAADGQPVSAKLVKSSGFDRLDKAAYDAVMQWRYVPGKRQGVPEAMTFNVPIKWVLE